MRPISRASIAESQRNNHHRLGNFKRAAEAYAHAATLRPELRPFLVALLLKEKN